MVEMQVCGRRPIRFAHFKVFSMREKRQPGHVKRSFGPIGSAHSVPFPIGLTPLRCMQGDGCLTYPRLRINPEKSHTFVPLADVLTPCRYEAGSLCCVKVGV